LRRQSLFSSIRHAIGVVDLKAGRAVHAIAGRRSNYRDVEFCCGDAAALLDHYQQRGLPAFYVADLDGITSAAPQTNLLEALFSRHRSAPTFVDVGCSSMKQWQSVAEIAERFPQTRWIIATETDCDPDLLTELASQLRPERIVLGLDYRNGIFVNQRFPEDEFVEAAVRLKIGWVIALDVASVGTGLGPSTVGLCQRLRPRLGSIGLISGGGVRDDQDVERLLASGCDQVLVATAVQESGRERFP